MRANKGFTLIELLVVIGIIGVLTGLVTVNLQDARQRARDASRKANLKQIQNAFELYKNDQNPQSYPTTATWQTALTSSGYMNKIPTDPLSAQTGWPDFVYSRDIDTLQYTLVGCLENQSDPEVDAVNNDAICDSTSGQYSMTLTQP